MIKQYTATVAFATELGDKKVFQVNFSIRPSENAITDEILENWAIFEGYEHLHANNIPTDILAEDGFFHERTLDIAEVR